MYKYGVMGSRVCVSNKRMKILSVLMVLYIYIPYFWNICEYAFGLPSIIEYLAFLLLGLISFFIYPMISQNAIGFLGFFAMAIVINCSLVSYNYYVFVEGVQAFVGMMVPCIFVTNKYFKIVDFLGRWYSFALFNIPLVVIAILLLKINMAHYSIFTSICVPNVFILSYGIMQSDVNKKMPIIVVLFNILATAVLGGRMAAVVCVAMLILAFLFSSNISFLRKTLFVTVFVVLMCILIKNLNAILLWLSKLSNDYGIRSRSVTLLIEQLSSGKLYTTNRESIYTLVIDYIKNRAALPGGFGVALYLTSGEYYYVHNFILQMLVVFGAFGSVAILIVMIMKFYKFRFTIPKSAYKLLVFMLLTYLLIGFTGSSFFIHYLATIFIALFFFGETALKEMGTYW